MSANFTPTILSIAGSDPYGGAGIQADLKAIHACGGYALTAISALTAQNSQGVRHVYPTPIETFKAQLDTLLTDIQVDAVKIGMLATSEIIQATAQAIREFQLPNVVLDTPIVSSSGHPLLNLAAVAQLKAELFPLATVITPNLPEVNLLLNQTFNENQIDEMADAFSLYPLRSVVIKGGHAENNEQATDTLVQFAQDSFSKQVFTQPRIHTSHTHGTGCSFASALATFLAKGLSLTDAVCSAKQQMHIWLKQSDELKLNYHSAQIKRKEPLRHLK